MNHLVDLNESATTKERFYAMASKAELIDRIAKARFEREPWYLTDKRIREGRYADGQAAEGRTHEHGRV